MTDVLIFRNTEGSIVGFEADGHAGYANPGEDIVCSAISVLTQTAIIALNRVCEIEEHKIEYSIRDGYLSLKLFDALSRCKRDKASIVLETMLVGLESLEEQYPEFITLKSREVD